MGTAATNADRKENESSRAESSGMPTGTMGVLVRKSEQKETKQGWGYKRLLTKEREKRYGMDGWMNG
ncbi:unnamed protein product [Cercopithifilaria johnstoni]|uniref:Uncharacterized protein n=1 Tax=Cercopithifilaria johnstoni TaxID=2874296 RepID=A0A8J2PUQ6_9BILA|nr:unnamed protein product [Cercopithifilaria johnstoni]